MYMGTVVTKTYLKRSFLLALAIALADSPSGYHTDAEGTYLLQDGAPLDTSYDYKRTFKVVIVETSRTPICPAGHYDNYAMTSAMTDTVTDSDGVVSYRLIVSAPTRRDAMEFYASIKSGETEPSRPFPAFKANYTRELEA